MPLSVELQGDPIETAILEVMLSDGSWVEWARVNRQRNNVWNSTLHQMKPATRVRVIPSPNPESL